MDIVVIGHVDHGKSTLIGRLLYDSDNITEGRVAEIQKLAEEYKKRFEFAYFLDSFDIKNMLTGASHNDLAVLVVAADEGIQEQTGRHAFLIHMLGIKQILVVVNKIDAVCFKEEVFQTVKNRVGQLLASFDLQAIEFIPGSALEGDNIYKKSQRMGWYHGPTLVEALGDEVIFQPSGVKGVIEKIRVFGGELEKAEAGDCVGIVTKCEPNRGDVCGLVENAPISSHEILGEAVLLDNSLRKGEIIELRCGTKRVRCEIKDIREKINSETGEVMEKNPLQINEHEAATILFATEPIVVEKFSDIPELGRFILVRDRNIGAGVVL
jgi:translation elongation factor EF-1alpha